MTWDLLVSANVPDIAGALRLAVDDQLRHGVPIERVEMAQIEAVVAAASQLASGDYLGLDAVTVKCSGHAGPDGTGRDATIELSLVAHPGRFTPVYTSEPAPAPTILRPTTTTQETAMPAFDGDVHEEAPLPGGPANGVTTSNAELALAAELAAVERDRVDNEQIQARIDEQARRVEEAKANPQWATTPEGLDQPTPLDSGTTTLGPTPEALAPPPVRISEATASALGVGLSADLSVTPAAPAPSEDVHAEDLPAERPLATEEPNPAPVVDVGDGQVVPVEQHDGETVVSDATPQAPVDPVSGVTPSEPAPEAPLETPDGTPVTPGDPLVVDAVTADTATADATVTADELPHVDAPVIVDGPAPEVADDVPPGNGKSKKNGG